MSTLQAQIEELLATAQPSLEVLLVEPLGADGLRVVIDHPDGVTLTHCEQATVALGELRERYALEISSPGTERPLTKPDHFQRFVGRRARVRTRDASGSCRGGAGDAGAARRSYTGELVGASESEVTLAADDGLVVIPYDAIQRSHLVQE